MLWYDLLSHVRSAMMSRIVENSHGQTLKNLKIIVSNKDNCTACSQGKLVVKLAPSKISLESPSFL